MRCRRDEQEEIRAETMAVLTDPDLAELWGPDAQAEVPVVGLIPGEAARARRMRCRARSTALVVTRERVLVVDFKTVRPVPAQRRRGAGGLSAAARDVPRRARPHLSATARSNARCCGPTGPRLMPISPALLDRNSPLV